MKNSLLIILLFFFADGYTQNRYIPKFSTILSANHGEKILNQCSRSVPKNVNSFFELTKKDIENLEENFTKIYSLKSTECCFKKMKISDLNNFAFQYVGVIINNEKYIYINALNFSDQDEVIQSKSFFENWKIRPIIICDGGFSYWGVLYNINKKEFSQLSINGSV